MDSSSTARRLPALNFSEIEHYLTELLDEIRTPISSPPVYTAVEQAEAIAGQVFDTISHRRFCYLSRGRSAVYRDGATQAFTRHICSQKPIRFYYDIGGGYHAAIDSSDLSLGFEPGLGEALIVRQISLLAQKLATVYPHGIRFTLVVDNLCALLVNDIPLERTNDFVQKLRQLIRNLASPVDIDVLVESELFSASDYVRELDTPLIGQSVDDLSVANVARFLGRPCTKEEAAKRIACYQQVSKQTDRNINSLIDGTRMTQRATPRTFPFRPFPGGASRIQAGELAVVVDEKGNCKPTLITTENFEEHRLFEIDVEVNGGAFPVPVLVSVRG